MPKLTSSNTSPRYYGLTQNHHYPISRNSSSKPYEPTAAELPRSSVVNEGPSESA